MHPHAITPRRPFIRAAATALLVLFALLIIASRADASPGALKIAIVSSLCDSSADDQLKSDFLATAGVASVDVIEGIADPPPSAATLGAYDGVVAANNCAWNDSVAFGDALADYQDAGGVVIADNWNFWDPDTDYGYAILGRWSTGGYSPFVQEMSSSSYFTDTYTSSIADHPILANVSSLSSSYSIPDAVLANGALQLAGWSSHDLPSAALKGRAVGVNSWFGNGVAAPGFAQLAVNAINTLGRRAVSVSLSGTGTGKVTSTAGSLACASACSGDFLAGSALLLNAVASKGSVFIGWSGACSGTAACSVTVGYPGSDPAAWETPAIAASFASTALKYGKYKKGKLSVGVPGAGSLTLKAAGVKTVKTKAKAAGTLKLKIKPTGTLKKKLAAGKSVKVKFKFAFTPTGAASAANSSKSIKVK